MNGHRDRFVQLTKLDLLKTEVELKDRPVISNGINRTGE